ncbi:MAG: serine/threonine-protein kinase [Gemmatimonadota bacterium]
MPPSGGNGDVEGRNPDRHLRETARSGGTQLHCPTCGASIPSPGAVCPACGVLPSLVPGETADPALIERLSRALGPGFEILTLVGRGGFADVYEILDRHLKRRLAVKVLRPEVAEGPYLTQRFEKETRALASLFHLNIPPIHFVGDHEGLIYYVMPLIKGRSLGQMVDATGPLDPDFTVAMILPVLEALEYAHAHGIIHRDIKPDNIIVEDGTNRPLLVDFGVAKQAHVMESSGLSIPGIILGTPGYISPEQALGQTIDGRSDIYAAGATLFNLLTGTTTFSGDTPRRIIGLQITGEIPLPSSVNASIPEWLSTVIMTAMSRHPEDRYQSASAMAQALRDGQQTALPRLVQPTGPIDRIRSDDPTPTMVPGQPAVTSPPWQGRNRGAGVRRTAGTNSGHWGSYLTPTLIVAALAWFALVPQRFVVRNDLALPVEISTNDGAVHTILAGGQFSMPLPAGGKVLTRWFVVQPRLGPQEAPLGEPISGTIRLEGQTAVELVRRHTDRSVNSWNPGGLVFAPRVTNRTSLPMIVTINHTGGGFNCRCTVLPGETRLLGYYRLEKDSFVRVENIQHRAMIFRDLPTRINLNNGVLDLSITDTVLSRSQ